MTNKRTIADDDADRQRILDYVRAHPGQRFEEAELKRATGVNKSIIRGLVRGVDGIDAAELQAGRVRCVPGEPAAPSG